MKSKMAIWIENTMINGLVNEKERRTRERNEMDCVLRPKLKINSNVFINAITEISAITYKDSGRLLLLYFWVPNRKGRSCGEMNLAIAIIDSPQQNFHFFSNFVSSWDFQWLKPSSKWIIKLKLFNLMFNLHSYFLIPSIKYGTRTWLIILTSSGTFSRRQTRR